MHTAAALRMETVVVQIVGSDNANDVLDPNSDPQGDGMVEGRSLGHEFVFRALLNFGRSILIWHTGRRIYVSHWLVHIDRYATEIWHCIEETIAGDPVSRVTARTP